jgi:Putative phage abortive infection protein
MKKKPSLFEQYKTEIVIVAGGLVMVNAIFIAKAFRQSTTVDPEYAAHLGSFVGGYIGPIFALIGVVLLFSTLKSQRLTSTLQNFETKYFELIKMHRDNVAEIDIKGTSGRRVFVLMIRELRCALEIIRVIAKKCDQTLSDRQLLHISYYCLFYGVGPNSSRMLKMSLSNFDQTFISAVENELNQPETKNRVRDKRQFAYTPFEGHQSRLGHYYRHLYQMVRYVDEQVIVIDKYEYVKTIRAQLSTHEQALLLVNSLTPIGKNWWEKKLLDQYRMVQNIPRDFFDPLTEIDVSELFNRGYFEWEDSLPALESPRTSEAGARA